jgi:hypothetical protein
MGRINIRAINGQKHNGHLETRFQRVQNRASAVLDAYDESEQCVEIDLVAHLHRIPIKQIEQDIHGHHEDFVKRYGTVSSKKFHQAITKCLAEINDGVHPALASVSYHVPYKIIHNLEENSNIEEITNSFFNEMMKLDKHNREKNPQVAEHNSTSVSVS